MIIKRCNICHKRTPHIENETTPDYLICTLCQTRSKNVTTGSDTTIDEER